MKFHYKIQEYQTKAVEAVIRVFEGQPRSSAYRYTVDQGSLKEGQFVQTRLNLNADEDDYDSNLGFANAPHTYQP